MMASGALFGLDWTGDGLGRHEWQFYGVVNKSLLLYACWSVGG